LAAYQDYPVAAYGEAALTIKTALAGVFLAALYLPAAA
jgi:hypothetical protein